MRLNKTLLFSALLSCLTGLSAIDIPFSAGWRSLLYESFNPAQEGKELSWNELYQASLGIQPIQVGPADFSLNLVTNRLFNETTISVQDFSLGFSAGNWRFEGGSSLIGHGTGFYMDDLAGLRRGYDIYRYQQSRFNKIAAGWKQDTWAAELAMGGNVHNQAMLETSLSWHPQAQDYIASVSFTQELRAMDSHWHSPVAISALSLTSAPACVQVKQTTALAYLPEYDTTQEHFELYHQSELLAQITSNLRSGIGIMYQNQDYSPKNLLRYQAFLEYFTGKLSLTPLSELELINSSRFWSHRITGSYHILPNSKISLFYEYQNSSQALHSIGLEADLSYSF